MKINDIQRIGAINPYQRNQNAHAQIQAGKKGKQKDEVQISPEAKELLSSRTEQSSPEVSEARKKKVEDLKNAVSTGTYHVDAGKIAEKLYPYIK
ncbi:anti-sigma28 factor FlgM [Chlamydia abortus]|nr:anti-sigma28 factor FlgM [Chlamydia abortus]